MSGSPVELSFRERVRADELLGVVAGLGGVSRPDEQTDGRLSRGSSHVWIYVDPGEESEPETVRVIEERLGGPVGTQVVLDMSSTEGSGALALELIGAWARRWRFVVDTADADDPAQTVHTPEELRALVAAGGVPAFRGA